MKNEYLEDLVSGPIPAKSQWPPRLLLSDRQKARNAEKKAVNRQYMPVVKNDPAVRTDSVSWAYRTLRFATTGFRVSAQSQMMGQREFNSFYRASLQAMAREAAAECGIPFADLVDYIVSRVKPLAPVFAGIVLDSRDFVGPDEVEDDEYMETWTEEDPADIEELRRAMDTLEVAVTDVPESPEVIEETRRRATIALVGMSSRRRRAEQYMREMAAK